MSELCGRRSFLGGHASRSASQRDAALSLESPGQAYVPEVGRFNRIMISSCSGTPLPWRSICSHGAIRPAEITGNGGVAASVIQRGYRAPELVRRHHGLRPA